MVRTFWAALVCWLGPDAKQTLPLLVVMLKDDFSECRRYAAAALGRIGPEAKIAVDELELALRQEQDLNSGVREAATEALQKIQPHDPPPR